MIRLTISALVAAFITTGCYSTRATGPVGHNVSLAGPQEACAPAQRKRVHYLIGGLVGLGDKTLEAPPNSRVRVVSETDPLDVVLRAVGYAFTFGLYGGTQSIVLETCYGAAGPAVAAPAGPPPGPVSNAPGYSVQAPAEVSVEVGAARQRSRRARRSAPRRPAAPRERSLAYCDSSIDCDQGFCKDRGDGIKLCMDDVPRGGYCASSIDCDEGFCKDRGDGLKVCM